MEKEEQGNMITEWLEKNGNPKIMRQVEKEAEELELHRYSEDYANCNTTDDEFSLLKNAFIAGAEWKKEKLYTEEEVTELLKKFAPHIRYNHKELPHTWSQVVQEWFAENKKQTR